MRDALNRTGRPILFSTEPFDLTPNPQAHIANLWRTTTDVADTVSKVRVNIDLNDKWAEFAGPGGFNDPGRLLSRSFAQIRTHLFTHFSKPNKLPDMLQCGKGSSTVNQWRSNFITWAIAKAPLLLSANISKLAQEFPTLLELLADPRVLAINQDSLGV